MDKSGKMIAILTKDEVVDLTGLKISVTRKNGDFALVAGQSILCTGELSGCRERLRQILVAYAQGASYIIMDTGKTDLDKPGKNKKPGDSHDRKMEFDILDIHMSHLGEPNGNE